MGHRWPSYAFSIDAVVSFFHFSRARIHMNSTLLEQMAFTVALTLIVERTHTFMSSQHPAVSIRFTVAGGRSDELLPDFFSHGGRAPDLPWHKRTDTAV